MNADSTIRDDELPDPGGRTGIILLVALACLLLLGGSIGVLLAVFWWQIPNQQPPAPRLFPTPRLFGDESLELKQLRAKHLKELQGYHWLDRNKKIVAIPIERAMQIIAQRGANGYAPVVQSSEQQLQSPSAKKPGSSAGPTGQASPSQSRRQQMQPSREHSAPPSQTPATSAAKPSTGPEGKQ